MNIFLPRQTRLQRWRERQRNGLACFTVVLNCLDTEEMLITSGLLAPADRDHHGQVEEALKRFMEIVIQNHKENV